MDYMINPIKMGGLVKEVTDDRIKVHLHGRLGVITIPKRLVITSEPDFSQLGEGIGDFRGGATGRGDSGNGFGLFRGRPDCFPSGCSKFTVMKLLLRF